MLIGEFFEIEFVELKAEPSGMVNAKLDLADNYYIDNKSRETRCCNCAAPI